MSKKSRKMQFPDAGSSMAKRQCLPGRVAAAAASSGATQAWSAGDDSLFADSKLDELITRPQESSPHLLDMTSSLFDDTKLGLLAMASDKTDTDSITPPTADDTLLSNAADCTQVLDMNIASLACGDSFALATGSERVQLNNDTLFGELKNDTLFGELNFDDAVAAAGAATSEYDDLFTDTVPAPVDEELAGIQNTQAFLEAVGPFKVPEIPAKAKASAAEPAVLQGATVQGTQYMRREQLQNASMMADGDLSNMNWETQIFDDPEPSEETEFPHLGEFYSLPDRVRQLIFEHKGIKSLYEWQDECLNLPAVRQRKNLIYALPTSGGKTLVAEILMLREIICRKRNVLFVLPYVSIVQEKVSAMSPFAIALDFLVDEYTAGKGKCPPTPRQKRKSIFVASIEKGAVLMDSLIEAKRADEISLVVVDELHLIGERGRGATLEAFLTKVMYIKAGIQIVGMSATIGNLSEISAFLNADVYTRGFRPVELKEYIKCGSDILEINSSGQSLEDTFVFSRTVDFKYSEAVSRSDPDHLAGLVTECAPENCCLIFCPSRKNCENVAVLLCRILPKSKFLEHRKREKADLMDALEKICGVLSPVLARTIPYGIAYHHSGLTTDERKFIETAYRLAVITVICCTSTLAAGVNLPAKRVIIRAPYVGSEFMTLSKYKQMVGRAGRAGMGEAGESILISSKRDNAGVGRMLFSPMDKALSSLDQNDGIGIQALVLGAIGLEIASTCRDLSQLIGSTLLAVQADELGISVIDIISQVVSDMIRAKVLSVSPAEGSTAPGNTSLPSTAANTSLPSTAAPVTQDSNGSISVQTTQKRRIHIRRSTALQLTTIGKAAFKAGVDYKRAQVICHELHSAQGQLILTSYCHLLYLVVCFNSNAKGDEMFAADPEILFASYGTVDEATLRLFVQLGFTEAQAAKLGKTLSIQGPLEVKLNRLYKMLILKDMLDLVPVPEVAVKYKIERGMVQNLVSQSTAAASAIIRLCEVVEKFWCFRGLFERVNQKIDRCGTVELEPLMDLPGVKINRAKQLHAAGFKTIADIAKCKPMDLVKSVEHMPLRIAKEIVSAAKIILMKKLDHLEEETEALKLCLS